MDDGATTVGIDVVDAGAGQGGAGLGAATPARPWGPRIRVWTDGRGVGLNEMRDMMSFGYCSKPGSTAPIGVYGGGFQVRHFAKCNELLFSCSDFSTCDDTLHCNDTTQISFLPHTVHKQSLRVRH